MTSWQTQTHRWYQTHSAAYAAGADACDTSAYLAAFKALLPGPRVLDLGCGTGRDMQWMQAHGLAPSGIEPSAALRAIAARKGLSVAEGTIATLPLDPPWDGIWCLGVFVHLPLHTWETGLRRIAQALAPNGVASIHVKDGSGESIDAAGRPLALIDAKSLLAMGQSLPSVKATVTSYLAPTSSGTPAPWHTLLLQRYDAPQ